MNQESENASDSVRPGSFTDIGTGVDGVELEYDEDFECLVSEENVKNSQQRLGGDGLGMDEDFEAELCAHDQALPALVEPESEEEKRRNTLRQRMDRFGIVSVSGTDVSGRPMIVMAASKLPTPAQLQKESDIFKNHQHFFDSLLEFLAGILDNYVESEYTLVYFHHGLKSTTQPSLHWLNSVYKMLDRKFKKNLKALYIVHPTMLFKIMWQFIRPMISSKFNKKVTYCNSLADLARHIDLTNLNIPEEVKTYDAQINVDVRSSNASTGIAAYGLHQQFKVPLEFIANNNNGDCVPLCVKEAIIFLRKNIEEVGIFRKSGSFERIKQIQSLYNKGVPVVYEEWECHVAACVLKAFVRELPESLLSDSIFSEMMSLQALDVVDKVDVTKELLNVKLPEFNYRMLSQLIGFLHEVSTHAEKNKMDAKNLSYIFGPNFLRKAAPTVGVTTSAEDQNLGLIDIERVNSFVEILIKYHPHIFTKPVV